MSTAADAPAARSSRRRIVLISGQSGAGKTTLGSNLATRCGSVVHLDGDRFYVGQDAIREAGTAGGVNFKSQEHELWWAGVRANFDDLFDGKSVPVDRWVPVLDPLCRAVAEASLEHPDVAVTFSVYQHAVRRWMRERIRELVLLALNGSKDTSAASPSVQVAVVVLNDAEGGAPRRKLAQAKATAASHGKTMEEYLADFNVTYQGDEHLFQGMTRARNGFEPGRASDEEIAVDVREGVDEMAVFTQVTQRLGLLILPQGGAA